MVVGLSEGIFIFGKLDGIVITKGFVVKYSQLSLSKHARES